MRGERGSGRRGREKKERPGGAGLEGRGQGGGRGLRGLGGGGGGRGRGGGRRWPRMPQGSRGGNGGACGWTGGGGGGVVGGGGEEGGVLGGAGMGGAGGGGHRVTTRSRGSEPLPGRSPRGGTRFRASEGESAPAGQPNHAKDRGFTCQLHWSARQRTWGSVRAKPGPGRGGESPRSRNPERASDCHGRYGCNSAGTKGNLRPHIPDAVLRHH